MSMDQKPPPVQKKGKIARLSLSRSSARRHGTCSRWGAALSSTGESRERRIWQNVFGPTSSRSVDMIFSIMGLFGVMLDQVRST